MTRHACIIEMDNKEKLRRNQARPSTADRPITTKKTDAMADISQAVW